MAENIIINSHLNFHSEPDENIMESVFKQYEKVIIESLITSFGLDFIVKDRHGGDVDTIHNVRKIGTDEKMTYKNSENEKDYDTKENYDSHSYHSHPNYISSNKKISQKKKDGVLIDEYTGKPISQNEKSDQDHVISAKEIHEDRGRTLSGLKGEDLANSSENLKATNPRTNRSKKADSMNDFLERRGDEYSSSEKARMKRADTIARKSYESKLAREYYTSSKFGKDVSLAAGTVGLNMGLRQALGFVFTELWFSVKEEFHTIKDKFDFSEFFTAIGNGVKKGFEKAMVKYKEILSKFKEGVISGLLSSLTTTICNIFFTTAKNIVRIIRQSYASLVQAAKILFLNPDNLPFGDRVRAFMKVLSLGSSVVLGTIVSEMIGKTAIAGIPVVGEVIQTFCGTLVTGIFSCSLLHYFDQSDTINKLVSILNNIPTISSQVDFYKKQAIYLEKYAAEVMEIDIDKFQSEINSFESFSIQVENATSESELNKILKNMFEEIGLKIPWEGDFEGFMQNRNSKLVFS